VSRLESSRGRLAAGDQLPSVRVLAERLPGEPQHHRKAYGELAREGVIDAAQGAGLFMAPLRQIVHQA